MAEYFKQRSNKHDLSNGLREWVQEKTGLPNAYIEFERLTHDDLRVLALATGWEPAVEEYRWILDAHRRKWEAQHKDEPFPLTIEAPKA